MFYVFLLVVGIGGVVVTRGGLQILASLLGDHDRRFPNVSHSLWWLINIFFKKFWCFCISNQYIQIQYFIKCFEGNKSQKRTRDQTDTCTFWSSRLFPSSVFFVFSLPENRYARLHFLSVLLPDSSSRCIKVFTEHWPVLIWKQRTPNMCSVCDGMCVLLYNVRLWGSHYWFTKSCV